MLLVYRYARFYQIVKCEMDGKQKKLLEMYCIHYVTTNNAINSENKQLLLGCMLFYKTFL